MNPYLSVAGLEPKNLAGLFGLNEHAFEEWAAQQRQLPLSTIQRVASILGVDEQQLLLPPKRPVSVDEARPLIWFRLRGDDLTDADREMVLLVRELGLYLDELEQLQGEPSVRWRAVFSTTLENVDPDAPPRDQGRLAASRYRSASGLAHGQRGIGGVVRGVLRSMGVLLVETPLPKSRVEGCTFYVGKGDAARPCILLNTHRSTWFRRNALLMHEIAHAIFDARRAGASVDFRDGHEEGGDFAEERADAFAEAAIVPQELLRSVAAQGAIQWPRLDEASLALLVAETHAEQRLILRAASEAGFITDDQRLALAEVNLAPRLKELTERALTTAEYLRKYPEKAPEFVGKRHTTLRARSLRLPVGYIKRVFEAQQSSLISIGRAARMLMIGEGEYRSRFGVAAPEFDEV